MSTDLLLLLFYVFASLGFSFLCSISEATLLSITPSFIAGLRDTKPALADQLQTLKHDRVDQSLAAILTVNTVANTIGAVASGAKAAEVFGDAWLGVFSGVLTLLILFVAEIIPKTLGATYWRQMAAPTAWYISLLVKLMAPMNVVTRKITQWLSGGKTDSPFNHDEFIAMAGIGERLGHINERESQIIRNLFLFKELDATAIMTPRIVMSALPKDATVTEALSLPHVMPFSRLPLYDDSLDHVDGFVLREDLLMAQANGQGDQPISALKRDLTSVLDSTPVSSLLETLLAQRQHIALVVGEYGETKGVVTLEDVVETLLGIEILDEGDRIADMQQLARQLWAKRAQKLGIRTEMT